VAIILSNGDKTFQADTWYDSGIGGFSRNVELGFLNGDDLLDVAFGIEPNPPYTAPHLGQAQGLGGAFGAATDSVHNNQDLLIADLDADGDADIAAYDSGITMLHVCTRTEPSFSCGAGPSLYQANKEPRAADLDQDGWPDLVGRGSRFDVWWGLPPQNGQPQFLEPLEQFGPSSGGYVGMELVDIDLDGFIDMVGADPKTNDYKITIMRGYGDRTFTTHTKVVPLAFGRPHGDMVVADFNEDGTPDFIFGRQSPETGGIVLSNP
jgi:hypothetical protein